jgi:hypothetical protein
MKEAAQREEGHRLPRKVSFAYERERALMMRSRSSPCTAVTENQGYDVTLKTLA